MYSVCIVFVYILLRRSMTEQVLSYSGGWAFLGEVGKLTPVAVQRGWMFDLAEGFLVKMTAGTPGENVTVAAWKGGKVHKQSMVADDRGEGAAIFQ